MPIRSYSLRSRKEAGAGHKPLYYFKGTPDEIGDIPNKEIVELFKANGLALPERYLNALADVLKIKALRSVYHQEKNDQRQSFFELSYQDTANAPATENDQSILNFRVLKSKEGRFLIHQWPDAHGIAAPTNTFGVLKNILKTGFKGKKNPNVISGDRKAVIWHGFTDARNDVYTIEMMAPEKPGQKKILVDESKRKTRFVPYATPGQILRVIIQFHVVPPEKTRMKLAKANNCEPEKVTDDMILGYYKPKIDRMKENYRKELKGWPVSFKGFVFPPGVKMKGRPRFS